MRYISIIHKETIIRNYRGLNKHLRISVEIILVWFKDTYLPITASTTVALFKETLILHAISEEIK